MISHLTTERYERSSGFRLNKHYGVFKYWPQVYELWWNREFAPRYIMDFNPEAECWQDAPHQYEMLAYCSRRR